MIRPDLYINHRKVKRRKQSKPIQVITINAEKNIYTISFRVNQKTVNLETSNIQPTCVDSKVFKLSNTLLC